MDRVARLYREGIFKEKERGRKMNEKEKWYFTFGRTHKLSGFVKVVKASGFIEARDIMCKEYGTDWAFQYSKKEWEDMENDPNRSWVMEKELPGILEE